MNLMIAGARMTVTMLVLVGYPALAKAPATTQAAKQAAQVAAPELPPRSSLVPAQFTVPTSVETAGFKVVPLGPKLAKVDFDAYMSSIEHLQKTFTRSTDWPHKGISDADAMRDMEAEQARFQSRSSFAYAVLTPDGSRERGCVYVYPSTVKGYDAVVRIWVTKAEYDAGFDAELYTWVTNWIRTDWPFEKAAYPGRAIEWTTWDSMIAANTANQTAP